MAGSGSERLTFFLIRHTLLNINDNLEQVTFALRRFDPQICDTSRFYSERHVKTTANNDWHRIREIFEEALSYPVESRRERARGMCGNDESMRAEVLSLLDSYEISENFMETPAVVQVAESVELNAGQLFAGQNLLHYEIQKLIGSGGMGEVYLARDTRLHRNVAIKLLRRDLRPHVLTNERLLREARAAALLEHPNICHIYEISEADGFNFIVMQYVVGTTLDEILLDGPIDTKTALNLAAQISDGVAEAHAQGLIHRDIKPANIIISEKKQAKILDFGLAKFVDVETNAETANRMESSGGPMGTIPYMSPEQLRGESVNARTDVFSLGAVLFEMFGRSSAFGRHNNSETMSAILNEEPDWSRVSSAIRPLLQKCLAKDQADRYESAGELAEAFGEVQKHVQLADPTAIHSTSRHRIDPATGAKDGKKRPLYFWQSDERESARQSPREAAGQLSSQSKSRWRGLPATAGTMLFAVAVASAIFVWQRVAEDPVKTEIQPLGEMQTQLSIADGYLKQRKFDEAVAAYQKLIAAQPDTLAAYHSLAYVYREQNRLNDAIEVLRNALAVFPDDGQTYINLSWFYSIAGQNEEAIQAAQTAITLRPNQSMAYTNLCRAYIDAQRADRAIDECNNALKRNPGDPESLLYIGRAYDLAGKREEANSYYKKAISGLVETTNNNPEFADAFYLLGGAYFANHQLEEAIKAYEKCLDLSPRFAKARYDIAIAHLHQNGKAEALDQYNRLVELDTELAGKLKVEIEKSHVSTRTK